MNLKNVLAIVGISITTTLASIWGYDKFTESKNDNFIQESGKLPANYAGFFEDDKNNSQVLPVDFTAAAAASTPAVVHIKTRIGARTVTNAQPRRSPFADLFGEDFDDFFGGGSQRNMQIPEQRASGSGVVITNDGYIVTNNHVIENADDINVTLNNKKSYKAELIGADPSSDLAVLKITGTNLPYLAWGNSDEVKLGQWVLAIGYPWTLDVTVTAGIVSAKARSLGLNRTKSNSPIESFIQTDAAVNQGNSGGALVDTDGKLIGINSAIASQTGSYAGYSYAIPVNLVKKIVGDLVKYGAVQRAYMGLQYLGDDAPEEELRKQNIKSGEGVYVSGVAEDGAAKQAGIKVGDYITGINGVKINSGSEMVEQVANYKPGDKININYTRDGKSLSSSITLRNKSGNYEIVKGIASESLNDKLGGTFENLDKKKADQYGIAGGVQVKKITGGLLKTTRMQEDFVITGVNGQPVKTTTELMAILNKAKGTVRLEGIYPGFEGTYAYPLNMSGKMTPDQEGNQVP
ncbi:MAG: trypsin-like peptidase domain-containing protein [Bacteroidota bacterium]